MNCQQQHYNINNNIIIDIQIVDSNDDNVVYNNNILIEYRKDILYLWNINVNDTNSLIKIREVLHKERKTSKVKFVMDENKVDR